MAKEEKRVLELDRYEHGVVINALNEMRNDLIGEERPTDIVDEVLLKAIDAPTKKVRGKTREERSTAHHKNPVHPWYHSGGVPGAADSPLCEWWANGDCGAVPGCNGDPISYRAM